MNDDDGDNVIGTTYVGAQPVRNFDYNIRVDLGSIAPGGERIDRTTAESENWPTADAYYDLAVDPLEYVPLQYSELRLQTRDRQLQAKKDLDKDIQSEITTARSALGHEITSPVELINMSIPIVERMLGKQIKTLEGNISRLKELPVKDYVAQTPRSLLAELQSGGVENLGIFMDHELAGLTAMLSIELNKVAIEKTQARLLSYKTAKELVFSPVLDAVMAEYNINTTVRVAAFVSQLGHESSNLSLLQENLNYSASGLMRTWPTRFNLDLATQVERNPEAIANIVYGGRMGNDQPGDGWRYRGRGYLQITGKENYRSLGEALGLDLINSPQ